MTISAHHSGVQLLNQAQGIANSAARKIHDASLPAAQDAAASSANPAAAAQNTQLSTPAGQAPVQRPDPVNAVVDLLQAKTYNQAGANVIQRSNEMTGNLLNTKV
ncbi:hypothetical protein [Photobacterium atrarenae]|uniref:Flagellar basal-body/hook protein C-terminal domain-containing protein n=1 Tax=Photobacterium atrarenae TaxID=865757 RepID=A0ABY5GMR8_9GAMM|nr:hypothetical protein [Photobacterium atrarenae]UTV30608.1 hypothetical protein NNL38_18770 [Photobacterium atrarenae]